MSNDIYCKVWDEIAYLFPNINGAAVEVWEWIRNFIPNLTWHVITYPWGARIWKFQQSTMQSIPRELYERSINGNIFRVTGYLCGWVGGWGCVGVCGVCGGVPQSQWRGALMYSLICACINGWVNNREAGDLRRHRTHYDVSVILNVPMITSWHGNTFHVIVPLLGAVHRPLFFSPQRWVMMRRFFVCQFEEIDEHI